MANGTVLERVPQNLDQRTSLGAAYADLMQAPHEFAERLGSRYVGQLNVWLTYLTADFIFNRLSSKTGMELLHQIQHGTPTLAFTEPVPRVFLDTLKRKHIPIDVQFDRFLYFFEDVDEDGDIAYPEWNMELSTMDNNPSPIIVQPKHNTHTPSEVTGVYTYLGRYPDRRPGIVQEEPELRTTRLVYEARIGIMPPRIKTVDAAIESTARRTA